MSMFLSWIRAGLILFVAAIAAIHSAAAGETGNFLGLDFKGSLGEGRHSRYVPPVTNPVSTKRPTSRPRRGRSISITSCPTNS